MQRILMFSREKLQAVYLYGDVTRADFNLEHSPVQAMLVFQEVSTDLLEIIAPAARQGYQDFKLVLKILSREDLRSSADVFPMEFFEAKEKRFSALWYALVSAREHFFRRPASLLRTGTKAGAFSIEKLFFFAS
ncbi:MAG: hypothetical protein HC912_10885 [Saprospiraceae bacterium]|nr:hypothetical protein [Saprospiraceae bacterium]